jgi:hypothetical protein
MCAAQTDVQAPSPSRNSLMRPKPALDSRILRVLIWGVASRTDNHDNNDGGVQAYRHQAHEIDERPQAAPPGIPYDVHLFGWNVNDENMRSEASE